MGINMGINIIYLPALYLGTCRMGTCAMWAWASEISLEARIETLKSSKSSGWPRGLQEHVRCVHKVNHCGASCCLASIFVDC